MLFAILKCLKMTALTVVKSSTIEIEDLNAAL